MWTNPQVLFLIAKKKNHGVFLWYGKDFLVDRICEKIKTTVTEKKPSYKATGKLWKPSNPIDTWCLAVPEKRKNDRFSETDIAADKKDCSWDFDSFCYFDNNN